jgi:hypothetical protein
LNYGILAENGERENGKSLTTTLATELATLLSNLLGALVI